VFFKFTSETFKNWIIFFRESLRLTFYGLKPGVLRGVIQGSDW